MIGQFLTETVKSVTQKNVQQLNKKLQGKALKTSICLAYQRTKDNLITGIKHQVQKRSLI